MGRCERKSGWELPEAAGPTPGVAAARWRSFPFEGRVAAWRPGGGCLKPTTGDDLGGLLRISAKYYTVGLAVAGQKKEFTLPKQKKIPTKDRIVAEVAKVGSIHVDDLVAILGVTKSSIKTHLKSLVRNDHTMLGKLLGFYPDAPALVDMVEAKFGKITGDRIMDANRETKAIVDAISLPELRRYLDEKLKAFEKAGKIDVDVAVLYEFILILGSCR